MTRKTEKCLLGHLLPFKEHIHKIFWECLLLPVGMQSLIWGGWNVITLVGGWVGECCNEPSIWVVIP